MRAAPSGRSVRRSVVILSVLVLSVAAAAAVASTAASSDGVFVSPGVDLGEIAPVWALTADGSGDLGDWASDVVATGLRTVYVAGVGGTEAGGSDVSLAKYVGGERVWSATYDGPAHGSDWANAVARRGSAIYTVGRRQSKTGDGDLLLTRWDTAGGRVWTRGYDSGARLMDEGVDVAVDGEGNVVAVGVSYSAVGGADWVIVSYRADGTLRYVRRYDGPVHGNDLPARMLIDADDRIYVVGRAASSENGADALTMKYAANGTRLWARRFNGAGSGEDFAFSLRARPGGGVFVVGETTGLGTGRDALLLTYTGTGLTGGVVTYAGDEPTGTDLQAFNDLEVLAGGQILCGGFEYRPETGQDRLLVRFDSTGNVLERSVESSPGAFEDRIVAMAKDGQGGVYATGIWSTGEATAQIYTQRLCVGGTSWSSKWPAAPVAWDGVAAIATYGVNAFVVGMHYDAVTTYDQCLLGYVY
ncbi:MAG: hypothetical protein JW767_07940 [Thermoleophilia bacterium]|nr:hypothetical protein [Thermoleophilia bacterium]